MLFYVSERFMNNVQPQHHGADLCACVCFPAWAKVELTMHESVEVYLGDSAQIPCQCSFTDAGSEPSFVMIQWFVVSTAGPAAKADSACLGPSNRALCSRAAPLKSMA